MWFVLVLFITSTSPQGSETISFRAEYPTLKACVKAGTYFEKKYPGIVSGMCRQQA